MRQSLNVSQSKLDLNRVACVLGAAAGVLISSGAFAGNAPDTAKGSRAPIPPLFEQKVTPSDGMANTFFGSAVAISKQSALIGADGDASFRGSAYIYTKSGGLWNEGQKLTPSDGLSGDEFGYRVALGDDTAVVTAFSATVNGVVSQGAAYVYVQAAGTYVESQKLTASDGGLFDDFGASVAGDRRNLAIGANGATVGDNPAQGAVYVYTKVDGVWGEEQKLIADDGAAYDNFGLSVAVHADTILVGAPQAIIDGKFGQGAVYVFNKVGDNWVQTQKITAADGAAGDGLGESIALSGDTVLIGAYNATVGGLPGAGAAYVFTDTGDTWSQTQKLTASDPGSFFDFGNAVALHGDVALVAADVATVGGHTSAGEVYIFQRSGTEWSQTGVLTASDGATDDFFGAAVALGHGTVLVSTPHPTINGNSYQGAAYFYERALHL